MFGMRIRKGQTSRGNLAHLRSRPLVLLSTATFINTVGNGLFVTTSVLFFTRVQGISPQQLGVGLTLGGLCGIAVGYPMGVFADRFGLVRVLTALLVLESVGVLAYLLADTFPAFLVAVAVVTFLDRGAISVRNALVFEAFPPEERLRGRAYVRAVGNAGTGLGAALAAIALVADTPMAYRLIVIVNAVTFLVTAVLIRRIGHRRITGHREPASTGVRRTGANPFRNTPFLGITLLSAILALHIAILEVGLPLWVTTNTSAPAVIISGCLILNTVMVILLQVRLSRGLDDPRRAATACFRSAVAFAVSCAALGSAAFFGPLMATALVLVGTATLTLGEILSSAGGWSLSYDLADPSTPGSYQGVFNSGIAAGGLLGPLAVTSVILPFHLGGWLVFALVFFLAGSGFYPFARRASTKSSSPDTDLDELHEGKPATPN
ncbi:MFS transporter [Streptosporangium jomthongense]|uniref:MFS transporter n=1 Tax=Streptosporangium jomthongense TaxID=1193683 RepID=A0ABV8F308_9ACTN